MSYPCNTGCAGFPVTVPLQNAVPCLPVANGATVVDDRYRTLIGTNAGKMLVVPAGGNTQAYLVPGTGLGSADHMVVVGPDGQARLTRQPSFLLPVLNPATGGNFPAPGPVQYLVTQTTGGDWRAVAAPTSGKYSVQTNAGSFVLVDAGTIPGLNEIAESGTTYLKGQIMVIAEPTPGNFVAGKLRVTDGRVVVGDVDDDGVEGYKALPAADYLEHPKASFPELRAGEFVALDDDGDEISGGLPQATVTGLGSISDGVLVVYSPTMKRFYKAPDPTYLDAYVLTPSAATTVGTGYSTMPGGHAPALTGTFNYENVELSLFMGMGDFVENFMSFGLFRDGSLIFEWNNYDRQNLATSYVDQDVPPGSHTYEWRWKRTGGSAQVAIRSSAVLAKTLR